MNTPEPAAAAAESDSAADVAELATVPILRTFAQAKPIKVLSGLAELSFVAGREGDEFDDWMDEADEALIDAFGFEKSGSTEWVHSARAALRRAFEAGEAQRRIDLEGKAPPARTMEIAQARALIYREEIEHPSEGCPAAIDAAVAHVAYKLAEAHPVIAAEAAYAAMRAFRTCGMAPSVEVAGRAMDRARAGEAQRLACENHAAERSCAAIDAATAIFGGGA